VSLRRRLLLSLLPLAGGWLLFRWAGGRSSFDAVLALVASVGGAAVLVSGTSRGLRVFVALLAGALAAVDVLLLHEHLRGERRDDGEGFFDHLGSESSAILERSEVDGGVRLRVRAMTPSPYAVGHNVRPRVVEVAWENGHPSARAALRRPWTFAVWADARGGADVFAKVRDVIAQRRPAFSVGVGDLVGMARRYQFEVLRDQMAGTSSPAFFVPGNHDVDPFGTLHPYRRVLGPPRWSFVEDGVLFLGLDTSSGRISDRDVAWIERWEAMHAKSNLVRERFGRPSPSFVLFTHYPLFPPTGRPDKALPQDDDATRRVQAFAQRRRALVFCGSYHAYDRVEVGGATQVTTGGAGSKLEGPGGHHVLFVTVGASGLSVEKVDVPGTSSPVHARLLVLRDEAAWVAREMPVRFARVWLLVAFAVGGALAAVAGGPSSRTAAAASAALAAPHAQQREPGSPG
jgi:hypothetical protein